MSNFFHGVEHFTFREAAKPVNDLSASIIGLVGTAGKGPVNTPVVINGSMPQAIGIFGELHNDGFSIIESLDTIFEQGGAVVVVVNVCDPAIHNTVKAADYVVLNARNQGRTVRQYLSDVSLNAATLYVRKTLGADLKFTIAKDSIGDLGSVFLDDGLFVTAATGITVDSTDPDVHEFTGDNTFQPGDSVWVGYEPKSAVVLGTHVHINEESGQVTVPFISDQILRGSAIRFSYTFVDPSKVTEEDVIGSISGAGALTGLEVLKAAPSTVNVNLKPRILIAPRFTQAVENVNIVNSVTAALEGAALRLNGRCIVDADPNASLESVYAYAQTLNIENSRIGHLAFPFILWKNPDAPGLYQRPMSALLAGRMAATDREAGGEHVSISNKPVRGVLGLSRPVDYSVTRFGPTNGESTANTLNSVGVTTVIFENGPRVWGNRQPNMDFLCTLRTFDMIVEAIALAQLWAVDLPMNSSAFLEQIEDQVRSYLRSKEARGHIVKNPDPQKMADVWIDPALNPVSELEQGRLRFGFRANGAPPLERLRIDAYMTNAYLSSLIVTR